MAKSIDQFSEEMRTKLSKVETGLHDLKAKIDSKASNVEKDARNDLIKSRSVSLRRRPK